MELINFAKWLSHSNPAPSWSDLSDDGYAVPGNAHQMVGRSLCFPTILPFAPTAACPPVSYYGLKLQDHTLTTPQDTSNLLVFCASKTLKGQDIPSAWRALSVCLSISDLIKPLSSRPQSLCQDLPQHISGSQVLGPQVSRLRCKTHFYSLTTCFSRVWRLE